MDSKAVAERTLRYLDVPAVVGFEEPFLNFLESEVNGLGRSTKRIDGLLVVEGGPLTISAHADRHGLITGAGSEVTYAAQKFNKKMTPSLATKIAHRYKGENVYTYSPKTGEKIAEGTIVFDEANLVEGDLSLGVEEFADIDNGLPIAFCGPKEWDGIWLTGQIDNAISIALAIEMLICGFEGTVLFTSGEETGQSWKELLGWFKEPSNQLLVLDTTPFENPVVAESGALVLRHADASGVYDIETTDLVERLCRDAYIEIFWKDDYLAARNKPLGQTELGRVIMESDGKITGTTVQFPTTDYHSNRERTTYSVITSACEFLKKL